MPYIKKEQRERFQAALDALPVPADAGELNYVITKIFIKYFNSKPGTNKNYQTANDIGGVAYCAFNEFYRRVIGKYEDLKIDTNGDVY